jgi:hypothetical protein
MMMMRAMGCAGISWSWGRKIICKLLLLASAVCLVDCHIYSHNSQCIPEKSAVIRDLIIYVISKIVSASQKQFLLNIDRKEKHKSNLLYAACGEMGGIGKLNEQQAVMKSQLAAAVGAQFHEL